MDVFICVGSSCHLKGSYEIIELMRQALSKHHLEEKVNLAGAFCLGSCGKGVSIKVNEEIISGVFAHNFGEIFQKHILAAL